MLYMNNSLVKVHESELPSKHFNLYLLQDVSSKGVILRRTRIIKGTCQVDLKCNKHNCPRHLAL